MMQPTLRYSTSGLSPRDSLLLRTLLRLLKEHLAHLWLYDPDQPHLQVQGDAILSKDAVQQSQPSSLMTVLVGVSPRGRSNYLCLPMRPDELLDLLNHTGKDILTMLASGAHASPSPVAAQKTAQTPSEVISLTNCTVRLKSWPPMSLLKPSSRLKPATLLLSAPLTVMELSQRTGHALDDCLAMVQQMRQAQLLDISWLASSKQNNTPPAAPQEVLPSRHVPPAGLLARIRLRLGL